MKWIAIALGAATLALAVGVAALVTQRDGPITHRIVPTTPATPIGAVAPSTPLDAVAPASPTKRVGTVADTAKAAPQGAAQPTRAAACNDRSDPTGDDCAANQNDNKAGDSQAGDSRDDQAGDNEPDENDNGN